MYNKSNALKLFIGLVALLLVSGVAYSQVHLNSTTNATSNTSVNSTTKLNVTPIDVVAKTNAPIDNQSVLNLAYAAISCRTAFVGDEINSTIKTVPSLAYLNSNLTIMKQDDTHLQTYIAGSNVIGFETYLHTIYDPAFAGTYFTVRGSIVGNKNISGSTKLILLGEFLKSAAAYINCSQSYVYNISTVKLQYYNNTIANFNAQISNMSAKGVDTSNMSAILASAQTQIITPLQSATASSSSSAQVEVALNKYCLFDGCPQSGINYHLDAKYAIAKLYAIDARLRSVSNDTADLNSAQRSLNTASSEMASIGTSPYQNGDGVQLWTNIQAAAVSINNVFVQLNQSK